MAFLLTMKSSNSVHEIDFLLERNGEAGVELYITNALTVVLLWFNARNI